MQDRAQISKVMIKQLLQEIVLRSDRIQATNKILLTTITGVDSEKLLYHIKKLNDLNSEDIQKCI